jgi:hypothetical protein
MTYARVALCPQKDFWYSFLLEDESTLGPGGLEGLGKLKNNAITSSEIEHATF